VILLGALAGDIHDIGKNSLSLLLTSYDFTVRDLGVDVPAADFLAAASPARLNPLAQAVYDSVRVMCEWRLGRGEIVTDKDGASLPQPPPIRTDEIVACLKRVRKSVQYWNKEGGRRGYLTFVEEYVP